MSNVYVACVCLMLAACTSRELSNVELIRFINDEDNGLRKFVTVNGITLGVTYRPTDLWIHQEIGGKLASASAIDSIRSKYDRYHYFILSLSRDDKEVLHTSNGMHAYSDLVQTMSFRMGEHVTLTTLNDSIPVSDFMLNRTYGLSNTTEILFAFSREKAKGEWVQFNLNEFGLGTGNQRFRFRLNDLERAPHLRLISDETKL